MDLLFTISVEETMGPVSSTKLTTFREALFTDWHRMWTTWMETATSRRRIRRLNNVVMGLTFPLVAPKAKNMQRAERYRFMDRCVVIGRGYNYATAFELSLKLKELTYVSTNAYSSADFRHGPIATIDNGLPVILIMPTGATYNDMFELAGELKRREAELVVISESSPALALAKLALPTAAAVPEWLSPITSIVPGQLLAFSLATAKGFDPDLPRGLKKVTRTF